MNPVVAITSWLIPLMPATDAGKGVAVGLSIIICTLAVFAIAGGAAWVLGKAGFIND